MVNIRIAEENDKKNWDSFVDLNQGSFFHYFDWNKVFEIKGWRFIPLIVEDDNYQLVGIFPIWLIKRFMHTLIKSLPEGASGGFVFKEGLREKDKSEIFHLLINYIENHFTRRVSTFTINENLMKFDKISNEPTEYILKNGFNYQSNEKTQLPCTFVLELKDSYDEYLWNDLWKRKFKQNFNKAINKGVIVKEDTNLQYKDDFLDMMKDLYIRLGSRTRSNKEILNRLTVFKNRIKIYVALVDEKPISSILCYYTPATIYLSKMPHSTMARSHNANYLLINAVIKDAYAMGCRYVEFGTTFTPTQEKWKARFMGMKIPMRTYKKTYSKFRCNIEYISAAILWRYRNSILKNKKKN